jgi:hypothetical protein
MRQGSFAYNCLMARQCGTLCSFHAGWDHHRNLNFTV